MTRQLSGASKLSAATAPLTAPLLGVPKSKRNLAIAVTLLAIVGGAGGYFLYQNSLQPSIQVTNISTAQPIQNPSSQAVVNLGRVSNSGTISYTAVLDGTYILVFDNKFSDTPKSVALTYSIAGGPSNSMSFTVLDASSRDVSTNLLAGQSITGSFTVAGTSSNDIAFQIIGDTCTQAVSFSFAVVNTGNANGFANVAFQSDGQTVWSNRYYVQTGQQLPESASASFSNCASHTYNIVVLSQQKS